MKITIGGASGTGTSTIAKKLAEKYNLKLYSGGGVQRMNAAKHGMTIEEYDVFIKAHPELDQEVEKTQMEIGQNEDDFVMESRLAWYAVPDSLKIKLDCDLDTRISRIVNGGKEATRIAHVEEDFETTKEKTLKREGTYDDRWFTLYGVHWNDDKNFDLIINTTEIGVEEVFAKICEFVESKTI
jgi:cytidylate kinase